MERCIELRTGHQHTHTTPSAVTQHEAANAQPTPTTSPQSGATCTQYDASIRGEHKLQPTNKEKNMTTEKVLDERPLRLTNDTLDLQPGEKPSDWVKRLKREQKK